MASRVTSVRSACIVVAALGTGFLLAGCSSVGDAFADEEWKTAKADATVTEAVREAKVSTPAGSIEITPGPGPGVSVRRTVHYRQDTAPKPGQKVSDGVLTFTDGCSEDCYIDYRLEVPAAAKVKLDSTSGDITVRGVAEAEVSVVSGNVAADRIGGPLTVHTTSGEVTATALSGPSAEVHSISGDTSLDFAKPPSSVLAESTSGDVTLRVPRAPYRLEVSTVSGQREVSLADSSSAASSLSVNTVSGDVRISTT
ncbi:DUF4097 family beta strand repeat-containing protein [Streptomyces sp. NPDC088762]|uniref:DUF4097 family beta strand repeat-containing protein n=1 Tax=Streptomyces sp. NPDC088762 TaxID=3365891 RepID=UPI00380B264E